MAANTAGNDTADGLRNYTTQRDSGVVGGFESPANSVCNVFLQLRVDWALIVVHGFG
jgi:hypothetical protein